MKITFMLIFFILLNNCTKPKTVLICGDHVCVNKLEAKQYFEDNLSLEVKIIERNNDYKADLVELNLKENTNDQKKIEIFSKEQTEKEIKALTKNEIKEIKKNIKDKNKKIKKDKIRIVKKNIQNNETSKKKLKKNKIYEETKQNNGIIKKDFNKGKNIVDICSLLKKCNIEEISKYLIKKGKSSDFPDITTRQK